MTVQELIARLEEHGPAGLSPEELEQLRQQLPSSPELQQVLAAELQLEESLAGGLSRPVVTVADVLRQASRASPARRWAARLGWMFGVLLLAVGITVWRGRQPPADLPPAGEPVVAAKTPARTQPEVEPQQPPVAGTESDPPAVEPPPADPVQPTRDQPKVVPAPAPEEPAAPLPAVVNPWPELDPEQHPLKSVAMSATWDVAGQGGLSLNDARRWLEPVAGHPHRFFEERRGKGQVAGFEGLVRLRPAWTENAVLRLGAFDCDQLSLHVWAGDEGVTLVCHQQHPAGWSAYHTSRSDRSPRPVAWSLVATDDSRFHRTAPGPVELRYQQGLLVLSRGDLRLMSVSLAAPPEQIFLDRRAWFRELSMFLGEPLPTEPADEAPGLMAELPASMKWETHTGDGSEFEIRDDGTVRLVAEKAAPSAWAFVRLPRQGLYEFLVQVQDPLPGAGICFGDAHGTPLHVVGYSRERRSGGATFGYLPPNASGFASQFETGVRPVPVTTGRQWLRCVFGSGQLRLWVSSDGRHWSRFGEPIRNLRGSVQTVGVVCLKHDQPRSLVLRRLLVRELTPLTELATADLRDFVPPRVASHEGDLSTWLAAVIDSQPPDLEPAEWRTVCAVQTLASLPPARLGNPVLNGLLEEAFARPLPLDQRLKILQTAAELWDAWDAPECTLLIRHYERLGMQAAREGNPRPWSDVGRTLLSSPLATAARFPPLIESLIRREVFGALYQDDWESASDVCRRVNFLAQPSQPDAPWADVAQEVRLLTAWVEGLPDHRRHGLAERSPAAKARHPLVVDLSKEGFNTLGEVQSALAEGSWREACQVISSVNLSVAQGLLPDAADNRLLVALPQAVDVAMRDFPLLKETMVNEFGPIARLRVNEAIVEGNAVALETAAVQFHGTEAAAVAHRWLGDRWLAAGEFARAAAAFQQALTTASPAQHAELQSRLRLTAALMGRDAGGAFTEPVRFQDQELSAAELEQLAADLRQRAAAATGSLNAVLATQPAQLPRPVRYEVAARLPLALEAGKNAPNWPRGDADWIALQSAGQVVDNTLYLTNRQTVAAIDLPSRALKWNIALGGEQGEAHGFHLTAMKPAITGDRLFTRRLAKDGPELIAIERATGNLLWRKMVGESMLSDPLIVDDALLVLSSAAAQDGLLHVQLVTLDPRSGEILSQRPLVRLQDAWARQPPCDLSLLNGRIVAALGGSIVCFDSTGQILWARRQLWMPLTHELQAWVQPVAPPVLAADRILVAQPGVLAVECLEAACGRRHWQHVLPDLKRIVGVAGNRVIVEGSSRLLGLSLVDGALDWETPVERIQAGQITATEGQVLFVRTEKLSEKDPGRPHLMWLDATSGQILSDWPLEALQEKLPLVGPIFPAGEELLVLWGKHPQNLARELAFLKPLAGEAFHPRPAETLLRAWTARGIDPRLTLAVDSLLPGWTCLGSTDDAAAGWQAEQRGQADVCATQSAPDRPVTLVRTVVVGKGAPAHLEIHAGCRTGEAWTLEVRVDGRTLETVRLEDATTREGWATLQVDLAPFAGRTITLVVEQQFSGKPALALWKRLEVATRPE